jgi:hypothetical protein
MGLVSLIMEGASMATEAVFPLIGGAKSTGNGTNPLTAVLATQAAAGVVHPTPGESIGLVITGLGY